MTTTQRIETMNETTKSNDWMAAARRYLAKLGEQEYNVGLRHHLKLGRKASTYRYSPSQYHADLCHELGYGTEESFKALKMEQGYSSVLKR
jgi:hypothetical protein